MEPDLLTPSHSFGLISLCFLMGQIRGLAFFLQVTPHLNTFL